MTGKRPAKNAPAKAGASPIASDEVFRAMAALEGFDIAGFDAWLGAMAPCGAKDELNERRQWARGAVRPGDVNRDALLRHLEWMLLRWRYIQRSEYILPLARTGKALADGRSKGGQNKETPAWHTECVKRATQLLEAGTAPRDLVGKLKESYDYDPKTIRSVLKKAGVK